MKFEVNSSNISNLEHDGKDLIVTFKGGKSYVYFDVPSKEVLRCVKAESVGSYFQQNIKNNYKNELRK